MARLGSVEVSEVLSLWRLPLDKAALAAAEALSARQPSCSIGPYEDFSQMTVYNFLLYYNNAGDDTATALSDMFYAMDPSSQGAIGGVAFIPQQQFTEVDLAVSGSVTVPDQCNIFSSGTGGSGSSSFYHFVIGNTGSVGATFLSCSASAYTTGGTYFQWLAFRWDGSSYPSDTCILAGMGSCCAVRCTFKDCPTTFNAQAPGCALRQCTIDYDSGPDEATAVVIAGSQCAIQGPGEFNQHPAGGSGGNGPKSCTGISVQGGADHTVIADTHISDWTTGIDFSQAGGSTNTYIRNCEIQSYITALNIEVGSDGAPITGVKVTSSLLARTNYSAYIDNVSPVVLIDPSASGNSSLSDIALIDCTVYSVPQKHRREAQYELTRCA